ncbi:unnamed protein product [Soboliphyme baturini]|uniref:Uncharacterized protein n=1 Tax=Soboliphyme baturini TaxID=241478 RepID=A0A183IB94_9BILA|nr:unnamed protein product [Soboliphyme baturini]
MAETGTEEGHWSLCHRCHLLATTLRRVAKRRQVGALAETPSLLPLPPPLPPLPSAVAQLGRFAFSNGRLYLVSKLNVASHCRCRRLSRRRRRRRSDRCRRCYIMGVVDSREDEEDERRWTRPNIGKESVVWRVTSSAASTSVSSVLGFLPLLLLLPHICYTGVASSVLPGTLIRVTLEHFPFHVVDLVVTCPAIVSRKSPLTSDAESLGLGGNASTRRLENGVETLALRGSLRGGHRQFSIAEFLPAQPSSAFSEEGFMKVILRTDCSNNRTVCCQSVGGDTTAHVYDQ